MDIAAINGDLSAAAQEVRPYVFMICLRYLRNITDAEDATQDTFIRALGTWGEQRFTNHGALRGWFALIAKRSCQEIVRMRAMRAKHTPNGEENHVPNTESAAITNVMLGDVMVASRSLQHDEYLSLIAPGLGYSDREVSEVLGYADRSAVSYHRKMARVKLGRSGLGAEINTSPASHRASRPASPKCDLDASLLTLRDASKMLGLAGTGALRRQVNLGVVKGEWNGKQWLVSREAVDQYATERRGRQGQGLHRPKATPPDA